MQENNTTSTNQRKYPLILIVEDDNQLAKMYSEKFKTEGFEVIVARDGEEGFRLISELKPSFVLLDMLLPKFQGQDVLAKLQATPQGQQTQIIALTNLAKKEEAQRALELGAKEYLVKAMYTPEQVVQKVKNYLGIA